MEQCCNNTEVVIKFDGRMLTVYQLREHFTMHIIPRHNLDLMTSIFSLH